MNTFLTNCFLANQLKFTIKYCTVIGQHKKIREFIVINTVTLSNAAPVTVKYVQCK